MMRRSIGLGLLLSAVLVGAGCTGTRINVTSEPSGARVWHAAATGPTAFYWYPKGNAPLSYYTVHQQELVKVVWPDGTTSDVQIGPADLLGYKIVDFDFKKMSRPDATTNRPAASPPRR